MSENAVNTKEQDFISRRGNSFAIYQLKEGREYHMLRFASLAELQKEADIIIAALCKVGVMQGEKAILTKMGIPMGPTRAPFIDLTDAQKEELFRAVFRSEWK